MVVFIMCAEIATLGRRTSRAEIATCATRFALRASHIYIYIYVYMYMHMCACIYTHSYIHMYIYTYIHTSVSIYLSLYTYIYIHIQREIYMYVCIYIYIYIQITRLITSARGSLRETPRSSEVVYSTLPRVKTSIKRYPRSKLARSVLRKAKRHLTCRSHVEDAVGYYYEY